VVDVADKERRKPFDGLPRIRRLSLSILWSANVVFPVVDPPGPAA
jgi:hypothetical protein